MKFGEKLIRLRRKNGMSQEQLAAEIGITRQSVSKWESGSTLPELAKLIVISELFDVSVVLSGQRFHGRRFLRRYVFYGKLRGWKKRWMNFPDM